MQKSNLSTIIQCLKKAMFLSINQLNTQPPTQQKHTILNNLKCNWYLPFSATAFFCLNSMPTNVYFVGLFIVFLIMLFFSSQVPSVRKSTKNYSFILRLVSITTACGVCFAGKIFFCEVWKDAAKPKVLEAMLPIRIDVLGLIGTLGSVAAIFFVYLSLLKFGDCIIKIFQKSRVFSGINTIEWTVYGVLLIASLSILVISFTQTDAFYGTKFSFDVIYTSDSPSIVKGNAYLALTHSQNDLRQPLFAVFTAPFVGIPFLVSQLVSASTSTHAILMGSVQIVLLYAANIILAKMMKLNSVKRICFVGLTTCTYTQLLFTLMMEQYIVAYFWLVLCLYLIEEKQLSHRIALWGAGGTLLTSLVLLPCMSNRSPYQSFKDWALDIVKFGFEFVVILLLFCRFDIIFNCLTNLSGLSGFAGKSVSWMDKFYQYTEFICNCFVAPNTYVTTFANEQFSWQLDTVTDINWGGILIFILATSSAILNHNKRSSLLAVSWIGFSIIILLVFGWGTPENGLILYALYFGWAFGVLLFQLMEKITDKVNNKYLLPFITAASIAGLLSINIPAITELVNFAISYYPI